MVTFKFLTTILIDYILNTNTILCTLYDSLYP